MYSFFLGVFIFVSICLIFLIMIQNRKDGSGNSSFSSVKSPQVITYYNDNMLTCVTGIFAFLFFFVSLIICNISYNNIL
ncbi:MAG: preprotein translocase subunit SecG [Buchnera aphidicola (Floraphis choui)]